METPWYLHGVKAACFSLPHIDLTSGTMTDRQVSSVGTGSWFPYRDHSFSRFISWFNNDVASLTRIPVPYSRRRMAGIEKTAVHISVIAGHKRITHCKMECTCSCVKMYGAYVLDLLFGIRGT